VSQTSPSPAFGESRPQLPMAPERSAKD